MAINRKRNYFGDIAIRDEPPTLTFNDQAIGTVRPRCNVKWLFNAKSGTVIEMNFDRSKGTPVNQLDHLRSVHSKYLDYSFRSLVQVYHGERPRACSHVTGLKRLP